MCLLISCISNQGNENRIDDSKMQTIIDSSINNEIPGIAAAIYMDGSVCWRGASGISSDNKEINPGMLFGIASITKTFTSVLTLQLIEEKKLSFDTKISSILGSKENIDDSITIIQLLNHTSGLFDPLQNPKYLDYVMNPAKMRIWSPTEVLDTFLLEPYFNPGKGWIYSNANYILLGLIIEKIENTPFKDVVRHRIFETCDLRSSYLFPDEQIDFSRLAHYWYDINHNGFLDDITDHSSIAVLNSTVWSGGGIICDVTDLAKWGYKIFNSDVLCQNHIRTIINNKESENDYYLGFIRRKINGHIAYGHTGGFTHSGELAYFPEKGISIAVLTNASVIENTEVMEQIAALITGLYDCLQNNGTNDKTDDEIITAAKTGDLKKIRQILRKSPESINVRDKIGHTPLSISAIYSHWDAFRYLIEEGADVSVITNTNSTVLHAICQHDRPDMAALLLNSGGSMCLTVKDVFGGYTPMLRAVQSGNEEIIRFLLDNGADTNEHTNEGWNALHLAAICGHRSLYKVLLEKGISVHAVDNAGKKPMDYDKGRPEALQIDMDLNDYVGNYTWKGAPDGFFVTMYIERETLFLDDYSINELYPIGKDIFYCTKNPWKIEFLRDTNKIVNGVKLYFIRQSVPLYKMN